MSVTLEAAEWWMRHIAQHGGESDTEQSHRLVVAELDRLRAIERRAEFILCQDDTVSGHHSANYILTGGAP